ANASAVAPNLRPTEPLLPCVWQHSRSTKVSLPSVRTSVASKLISVAPKALTAAAYKLARILYRMLKYGAGYVDQGEVAYEVRYRDRLLRNLKRRAAELGFQLTAIHSNAAQLVLT